MADVCYVMYMVNTVAGTTHFDDRCNEGDILYLYVSGNSRGSVINFNSLKAQNCNHKYTISIHHPENSLELSCIYKNNGNNK